MQGAAGGLLVRRRWAPGLGLWWRRAQQQGAVPCGQVLLRALPHVAGLREDDRGPRGEAAAAGPGHAVGLGLGALRAYSGMPRAYSSSSRQHGQGETGTAPRREVSFRARLSTASSSSGDGSGEGSGGPPRKRGWADAVAGTTRSVALGTWSVISGTGSVLYAFVRNPLIADQWISTGWKAAKEGAEHFWEGSKLLATETRTSYGLMRKRLQGHTLSRRERQQLVRTTADLSRMIPFMVFVIVPFMEFLLPFALKLWPNMLPSTFQESYKAEEDMKKQLKLRLEMASFLQDMVGEMEYKAHSRLKNESPENRISVEDVRNFMEQVRMGHAIDESTVLRVAKLFSDELTTDNMSRSQLVMLCKYMGLVPFGNDDFLRYQLRNKINALREDDASIYFEGVNSLNLLELKQACQERGMRPVGLTMHQLRTQLKRWIDLSVNKNVPLSLLILSRVFTLKSEDSKARVEEALSEALSQMDADVLQQALVTGIESKDLAVDRTTLNRLKLDAIKAQNERIQEEIQEKARKAAFLEQLRVKALAELSGGGDQQQQHEQAQLELRAPNGGKLSRLDQEIRLERPAPDMAKPLLSESGTGAAQEAARPHAGAASSAAAAVAAAAGEGKEASDKKQLTKALEDLKVLASVSSLEEEKKSLEKLLEKQEVMDAAKAVGSGRIVKAQAAEEATLQQAQAQPTVGVAAENKPAEQGGAASLLKKRVKNMVDKLEIDMSKIDQKIGNKLKVLDLDGDGRISTFEVRQAVIKVLKKSDQYSEATLDRIVENLDVDKDGIISLDELDKILERLRSEVKATTGE